MSNQLISKEEFEKIQKEAIESYHEEEYNKIQKETKEYEPTRRKILGLLSSLPLVNLLVPKEKKWETVPDFRWTAILDNKWIIQYPLGQTYGLSNINIAKHLLYQLQDEEEIPFFVEWQIIEMNKHRKDNQYWSISKVS